MMRILYRGLASARLTLFLFLILAVTSILGTLVQQGFPRKHYEDVYGPALSLLLEFFHVSDLYHSWWFTGLFLLLAINVAACTTRQISRFLRQVRSGDRNGDDRVFQRVPTTRVFQSRSPIDDMRRQSRTLLLSLVGEPTMICREETTYLYAERGRYAGVGMIGIHISVLLILAGGLIGTIWGFSGQMRIDEGTSSNIVRFFGSDQTRVLPFTIACDDFSVALYENGMPREYRSDVTVLEGEKKVLSATIRVNEPLKYKGLKFCQATYGIAGAGSFKVVARHAETGKEVSLTLDP
ncbi:MAG: cytochrome c biogenesis protein ResB [Syntrophales bacterium]|nr:cytochrome c biogenesis protein ResB [Syntrophales bacterium]